MGSAAWGRPVGRGILHKGAISAHFYWPLPGTTFLPDLKPKQKTQTYNSNFSNIKAALRLIGSLYIQKYGKIWEFGILGSVGSFLIKIWPPRGPGGI